MFISVDVLRDLKIAAFRSSTLARNTIISSIFNLTGRRVFRYSERYVGI